MAWHRGSRYAYHAAAPGSNRGAAWRVYCASDPSIGHLELQEVVCAVREKDLGYNYTYSWQC